MFALTGHFKKTSYFITATHGDWNYTLKKSMAELDQKSE